MIDLLGEVLGILAIANDSVETGIFEVSFSEVGCGDFEDPFFESGKFTEIFLVVRPDILHRRVEVKRGWNSRNRSDVFCNGKG